jgi:hypothetical protein
MEGTSAAEAALTWHFTAAVKPLRHPKARTFLPLPISTAPSTRNCDENCSTSNPPACSQRERCPRKDGPASNFLKQQCPSGTNSVQEIWSGYLVSFEP